MNAMTLKIQDVWGAAQQDSEISLTGAEEGELHPYGAFPYADSSQRREQLENARRFAQTIVDKALAAGRVMTICDETHAPITAAPILPGVPAHAQADEAGGSGGGANFAFEVTEDDVANVLSSNALAVANTQGKSFAEMAAELFSDLDFELIEQAALGADDFDEQVDSANDEIARQLREMGVLEPLRPVDAGESFPVETNQG